MTLGDILKQYRIENDISMDEFARRSSLSKGYISMLENNINPRNDKPIAPTLPTIKKIAIGMNTDVETLLKSLDVTQKISLETSVPEESSCSENLEMPTDFIVELDSNERILIETYQNLPQSSKDRLLKYASTLADMHALEEPIFNPEVLEPSNKLPQALTANEKESLRTGTAAIVEKKDDKMA